MTDESEAGDAATVGRFTVQSFDLDEIAQTLENQDGYDEMVWLVDPNTAELVLWTSDTGVDGENPIELEDVDGIAIDPIPSYIWYQDMVDFAEGISDETAARRLARALRGRGAFRHFKDELHEEYPDLVPVWYAFRDVRARRRAVRWLVDNKLLANDQEDAFAEANPDPDLP